MSDFSEPNCPGFDGNAMLQFRYTLGMIKTDSGQ
jgi:hypothetical protein